MTTADLATLLYLVCDSDSVDETDINSSRETDADGCLHEFNHVDFFHLAVIGAFTGFRVTITIATPAQFCKAAPTPPESPSARP